MERFRILMNEALRESKDKPDFRPEDKEWLNDPYIFVHGVPNLEVLNYFIEDAKSGDIPISEWRDTVYIKISETQRRAFFPVKVGAALGPVDSDKIKAIIGDLPLL
jgi:hypothetical protein